MSLPTKTSLSYPRLSESIWLFHGPPGIGKSTLASGFRWGTRSPLFLYTSSVKYIDAYKMPMNSWATFKATVKRLERERPKRYSFIVVDVVDILYLHCRQEVCESINIAHESDLDHGKGWDAVKKEWTRWVAKLCTLGYGVVFVSHSEWKEIKTRIASYHRVVPTLQGAGWRTLYPLADFVGYVGFSAEEQKDEGRRTIFFKPTEYVDCKDWTGRLPHAQRLWRDPARTFRELKAALVKGGEGKPRLKKARLRAA